MSRSKANRRVMTRAQRRERQAKANRSRALHGRIAAAVSRGDRTPAPLNLDPDSTYTALSAAITKRFGPGEVVLGITGTGHHPGIHRSALAVPLRSRCCQVSHGRDRLVRQVIAVTDDPRPHAVIELLQAAGIDPCRMCSRCWPGAKLPRHDLHRCFRKPVTHQAAAAVQA